MKHDNSQKLAKTSLVIGIINMLLLVMVIVSLPGSKTTSVSGLDEIKSQLTTLQSAVASLSNKPAATSTISTTTCTGTLNQNLSGSSYSTGSISSYSLSGTSPLNLTCTKL